MHAKHALYHLSYTPNICISETTSSNSKKKTPKKKNRAEGGIEPLGRQSPMD